MTSPPNPNEPNVEQLALNAWRHPDDDGICPADTRWDTYKEAWLDGFETAVAARQVEGTEPPLCPVGHGPMENDTMHWVCSVDTCAYTYPLDANIRKAWELMDEDAEADAREGLYTAWEQLGLRP